MPGISLVQQEFLKDSRLALSDPYSEDNTSTGKTPRKLPVIWPGMQNQQQRIGMGQP